MVQKLKAALGRIELRILFLLATGIVLVSLAAALAAQNSKTPAPVDDGQTVATWDDLLKKYLAFREEAYLMTVPAWYLDRDQVAGILNTYGVAAFSQEPDWYWNFEAGVFLYKDGSPLSKLVTHGTRVVLFEDMAAGELLILNETNGQEEIVYKAPAWPAVDPKENYDAYLARELSKRRVVWKATLKNTTLAAKEDQQAALAASQTKSGGVGMMLLLSGGGDTSELYIVQMSKQTNGMRLDLSYPSTSFVGTVWSAYSYEAPACPATLGGTNGGGNPPPPDTNGCTNCSSGTCNIDITNTFQGLDGNPWTLVSSNIVLTSPTQTVWTDTRPLGVDANTNPIHRFYTFGNNGLDSDGDGLSDARELLVHQTSTGNPDTDGDGASDGDEVIHGTNPLNNPGDMDGDGLSDDLEITLGTDMTEADSDLDWVSDGYEVQQGFNPLSVTSTPPLVMTINDGAMYAASTNLTLTFPGLVADKVVCAQSEAFSPSVTNNFTNTLTYALTESSNGWRAVFSYLVRGASERSHWLSGSIILDTLSPTATITAPTNGTVTSRAWVRVEGVASDSVSAVKVMVNGALADGVIPGAFWQNQIKLSPGTNAILVTGQDEAGNSVMQAVSVVQSFTGDSTAPHATLSLPKDYQITGGVTNWFDRTTLGSNEVLFLHGTIDDDSADISFTVTASGQTNGPIQGDVLGTQVWGTVQLFTGTNLVLVTASDAAGNSYSTNYTVIRQTNFFFEITNPTSSDVLNSPSTTVSGVASLQFTNATITVNGVGTVISNHTTNVTFTTVTQVPLQRGRTQISAKAELNGQSYYADPSPSDYEVLEWHNDYHGTYKYLYHNPVNGQAYDWQAWASENQDWNADTRTFTDVSDGYHNDCEYYVNSGVWICDSGPLDSSSSENRQVGPRSLTLGTYESTDHTIYWDTGHEDATWAGYIRYVKHSTSQELQTVVFQFDGLNYGLPWWYGGNETDPTRVTYRGATGFTYNGHAAFIVPIETEREYTLKERDFTWPEITHDEPVADGGTTAYKGHWLAWNSFTNDRLLVTIDEPDGLPVQTIKAPDKLFRQEPSCFEWQYVHTNDVWGPYSQVITGYVSLSNSPFGYYWTVNKGHLTNEHTSTPTFSSAGMSVPAAMETVELKLCAKADCSGIYTTRTLEVYRDHLERDYENFGTGIKCGDIDENADWQFSRYGVTITMPHTFNCFGSVWHAYDGSHDGQADDVPIIDYVVDTYTDPINWSSALATLKRGDIVVFYHDNEIEHAHTCMGSIDQMYGANNEPGMNMIFIGHNLHITGTWKWYMTSSQTYYDTFNSDFSGFYVNHPQPFLNKIKVYRKL